MHLADYLAIRAIPAAGISLALTRRCPLSCAHCATNSTFTSEEAPAELFIGFVDSFTVEDHPEVLAISGGEAFLRPALLQDLAERAALVGCKTASLSGMFWAKSKRIPPPIKRAIDVLDHFSVSLDVFHEQEVDRFDVYRVLEQLVSEGKDVSVHIVGMDADDPYLAERTAEVREVFEGRVPMLVNCVNAVGRAREWLDFADVPVGERSHDPEPCTLAAWPLVAFDGTIVACGNDDVVDGPAPDHLRLGDAHDTGWPEVRRRALASSMLRGIRAFGPEYLVDRQGSGVVTCDGYCSTCQLMGTDVMLETRVEELMAGPTARLIENQIVALQQQAGPQSFARRYGLAAYAELVTLGGMSARLTWREIEDIRHERGRSTLLFITDRCPVGCAHCSVDSRRDSPTITDFELFSELVEWLCAQPLEVVGVSGGEPFVERRGLSLAARRVSEAGKKLVVYTSGVWATRPDPPAWIAEVLDRCETVFLSTDAFHAEGVGDGHYVNAARAIARSGAWIVVQVLDVGDMVQRARGLLQEAFGEDWESYAELRPLTPLTAGRGADVFTRGDAMPGHMFQPCTMVASPMIRYDGVITACCNESVIMGWGPPALRKHARDRHELTQVMEEFHADPMLRAIGGVGPGVMTSHPRFSDLAQKDFTSICDLCWKMFDRTAADPAPDPLIGAISTLLVKT